jgi:hypothetical protein
MLCQVADEYAGIFTAVVDNVDLEDTISQTVEIFEREAKQPFWARKNQPLPSTRTA